MSLRIVMSDECEVVSGRLAAVVVLVLLCGAAWAAPVVTTLGNGMKVCVAPDNSSDIVSVQLLIHATADCEPDDKAGLRTVLQHAVRAACDKQIEGDEKLSFLLDMSDSGGGLGTSSDWEYMALGYGGTSDTLPQALAFLAEAVFRPQPTEEVYQSARDLVKSAATGPASAPAESTIALFRLAMLKRVSRAYPLGTPKTLENITLADLKAFQQRYCVPSLATLVVLGPVEVQQTQELVAKCFGSLPGGDATLPAPPDVSTDSDVQIGSNPELTSPDERRMDIASLVVGVPAPGLGDSDEAVTYIIHSLLGGESAPDGRISKDDKLWEALGLPFPAKTARASRFVQSLPPPNSLRGQLAIHAYIDPRQAEDAKLAILSEFESLAAKPPAQDELARARQQVLGSFARLFDEPANRALMIGRAVALGLPDRMGTAFTREVMTVTPEDVQRVAKLYFGHPSVGIEFPADTQ
jgi:zinc protease